MLHRRTHRPLTALITLGALLLTATLAACASATPQPAATPVALAATTVPSTTAQPTAAPATALPAPASPSPPPTATSRPATATRAPASPTAVPPTATATPRPPTTTAPPTATQPPVAAAPPATAMGRPPLTLDDVFPPRDLDSLGLDPSRLRTLIATGDVIPARSVDTIIRRRGDDFQYPLAATKDLLRSGDLTVINLEAPLIERCPPHDEGFTFCGRPGFIATLKDAGVDVATLENNHIGNYGMAGINETIQRLNQAGIAWARRDRPTIVDMRGLKVGFLAFNGVGEEFDRDQIADALRALRPQVDILAVAFHWGAEYVDVPRSAPGIAPDNPVAIAHLAVDNGADLVIGNHPHWVQAAETYKGKYITYAHGNFVFDQMWSYETRVGMVGRYTFYDDQLVRVEYVPVLIQNYAQPVPLRGQPAQQALDTMAAASRKLAAQLDR